MSASIHLFCFLTYPNVSKPCQHSHEPVLPPRCPVLRDRTLKPQNKAILPGPASLQVFGHRNENNNKSRDVEAEWEGTTGGGLLFSGLGAVYRGNVEEPCGGTAGAWAELSGLFWWESGQ